MAIRSTSGQSTSPRRAAFSARRPATVAAAPSAEPMRKPACQTRSSRHDGRRSPRPDRPPRARSLVATAHRAGTASSTRSTSGNADAEQPARERVERRRRRRSSAGDASPRRRGGRRARSRRPRVPGASSPLIVEQLGQRRRRRRRRVDDRDAVARRPRDDGAQQRVVGAAEQERVDRRAEAGAGRSNSPAASRSPSSGASASATAASASGPLRSPASTSGTSVGVACS